MEGISPGWFHKLLTIAIPLNELTSNLQCAPITKCRKRNGRTMAKAKQSAPMIRRGIETTKYKWISITWIQGRRTRCGWGCSAQQPLRARLRPASPVRNWSSTQKLWAAPRRHPSASYYEVGRLLSEKESNLQSCNIHHWDSDVHSKSTWQRLQNRWRLLCSHIWIKSLFFVIGQRA